MIPYYFLRDFPEVELYVKPVFVDFFFVIFDFVFLWGYLLFLTNSSDRFWQFVNISFTCEIYLVLKSLEANLILFKILIPLILQAWQRFSISLRKFSRVQKWSFSKVSSSRWFLVNIFTVFSCFFLKLSNKNFRVQLDGNSFIKLWITIF